jgi:hypothetical protein
LISVSTCAAAGWFPAGAEAPGVAEWLGFGEDDEDDDGDGDELGAGLPEADADELADALVSGAVADPSAGLLPVPATVPPGPGAEAAGSCSALVAARSCIRPMP